MTLPRLVKFYRRLPQPEGIVDSDLWEAGLAKSVLRFRRQVKKYYNEATLGRLLESGDPEARRAAVVALSLVGGMAINTALASRLMDDDEQVRRLASDAMGHLCARR